MTSPMPLTSPDDQRVTFVELFFDLVFVFSVTQVVHLIHGHVDPATMGRAVLVFWMIWWAWTQFTWALNAANTDHPRVQFMTLVATAVAFFMAVGVPGAFGAHPLVFAGPYVAVRALGLLLYDWVAGTDAAQRRAVRAFGTASVAGMIAAVVGAWLGGSAQIALWGLAIALDLAAAGVGGKATGWNLHPDHFVERHGLIVIIALGETLIVAAAGLVGAPASVTVIGTGALVVAVVCALWWTYFARVRPRLEHALAAAADEARAPLARDAFSVLHFPMLAGIIAGAVAIEEVLAHPGDPLAAPVRLALALGTFLFVGGAGIALWRATGRRPTWRLGAAVVVAAAVAFLAVAPWVTMTVLLLGLVSIVAVEHAAA